LLLISRQESRDVKYDHAQRWGYQQPMVDMERTQGAQNWLHKNPNIDQSVSPNIRQATHRTWWKTNQSDITYIYIHDIYIYLFIYPSMIASGNDSWSQSVHFWDGCMAPWRWSVSPFLGPPGWGIFYQGLSMIDSIAVGSQGIPDREMLSWEGSSYMLDNGWKSYRICRSQRCVDLGMLSLPSGKQPHNYGTSHFFIGKSTINGDFHPFSIAILT
jgi:hypothetical protein